MWQEIATALIVTLAAGYLGMGIIRRVMGKQAGGCGSGCSRCDQSAGSQSTVVQITQRQPTATADLRPRD